MADLSPWLLMNPLPQTLTSADRIDGPARLASPEPKEVAVTLGGPTHAHFAIPRQPIDTVFLGFSSPLPANTLHCWSLADGRDAIFMGWLNPVVRPGRSVGHALLNLAQPIDTQRVAIVADGNFNLPAGLQLGVLAVGRAFRSQIGYDFGHGRGVIDTGSATRRRDGGFGIQRGARASSWTWTLGELSLDETDRLHDLLLDVGETASVLVCEDVARAATDPRVLHWSLLKGIEPYARDEVALSRWGFQLQDWA